MGQVAIAAIPAVASLLGGYMADRTNRKGMKQQTKANDAALAFEKKRYEDEQKAAAEDRAYRNAIRAAWAKRHGIDWQPGQAWPPGGSGGGGGGLPSAPLMPPRPRSSVPPSDGTAAAYSRMGQRLPQPGTAAPDEEDMAGAASSWNAW